MNRRSFLAASLAAALERLTCARHPLRDRPGSVPDDDVDLVRAFLKRSKEQQQKAVTELRTRLNGIASPWLSRVAAFAARGASLRTKQASPLVQRAAHLEEPTPFAELPGVIRVEYLWGHRVVRTIEQRAPTRIGTGRDSVVVPVGAPAEDLLAALHGVHPDLDLALAGALAVLDASGDADDLALFLDGWRNGQESFYRALDRTAGTKEAVFYFDAMLGEFQKRFAPRGATGSEQLKSLTQLHDALHDGFLVYRQYRAMREAAACTAVLPDSVRLPKCLSRYDTAQSGYALRDALLILAELDAHDPLPGLQTIQATMAALPRPLWATGGKYDALPPFQKAFDDRLRKAIDERSANGAVTSEALRRSESTERLKVSAKIAEAARAAAGG